MTVFMRKRIEYKKIKIIKIKNLQQCRLDMHEITIPSVTDRLPYFRLINMSLCYIDDMYVLHDNVHILSWEIKKRKTKDCYKA